ncbi:hypothetical protein K432DRAFT_301351 [Lepidopterella palustris CBS 459.81]|uniref:Flavin-containing monooxygenase n=1 Tax=Lepidopterella palustris CBS 459.81 TaxID=1314670 RepID=A0A8E2E7R4_9PEZI|nr:hypothetical protein K432DRAFT_301351 [Lepidopterella palustris CBS 459.81]
MLTPKITAIGAGVVGLSALKNLLEAGLNAICLDERDSIGGFWKFTSADQASASLTIKMPPFPTKSQVQDCLEAYAKDFDPLQHIHLSTTAAIIRRNSDDSKWIIAL